MTLPKSDALTTRRNLLSFVKSKAPRIALKSYRHGTALRLELQSNQRNQPENFNKYEN
jgi:hypothetical protein